MNLLAIKLVILLFGEEFNPIYATYINLVVVLTFLSLLFFWFISRFTKKSSKSHMHPQTDESVKFRYNPKRDAFNFDNAMPNQTRMKRVKGKAKLYKPRLLLHVTITVVFHFLTYLVCSLSFFPFSFLLKNKANILQ